MARSETTTKVDDRQMCQRCERVKPASEFDYDPKTCRPCVTQEIRELAEFRRQTVVGRTAMKLSVAEDLLAVLDSTARDTIARFLDALAGLAATTSGSRSKTLTETRHKRHNPPMPLFASAWADEVQRQADDQLWDLTENINAFLNRPTDPKTWPGVCDTCGHKRIGEASYCQRCGTRILEGSRRCRVTGCPNEKNRRADCPDRLPTDNNGGTVPHPD